MEKILEICYRLIGGSFFVLGIVFAYLGEYDRATYMISLSIIAHLWYKDI